MADRLEDRVSLKDLDGVRVEISSPLPPDMPAQELKAGVERQLRMARIRVLGMGEFPTGDPHLRVTVSVSDERGGLAGCFVQLDFVQIVFMRRNPQVTFNRAQTWKADARLMLVERSGIRAAATAELARQVEQFVADYQAVNA